MVFLKKNGKYISIPSGFSPFFIFWNKSQYLSSEFWKYSLQLVINLSMYVSLLNSKFPLESEKLSINSFDNWVFTSKSLIDSIFSLKISILSGSAYVGEKMSMIPPRSEYSFKFSTLDFFL